ncbi:MAG TPA: UDP-glucose--hexose-1-phosphate uridylyltransferase [Pseudomonadales bacterium]|nr:UDP-glucose--hexose-1-phosphate uridylyltransferase [Pseudomonadales bacterium]
MAERRRNPLTGEWVIVSPGRANRPWQGESTPSDATRSNRWEATCYLCPRNTRAKGAVNPDYRGVFAFDNDFSALQSARPAAPRDDALFRMEPVGGACRVLCFSERHDATLATLDVAAIAGVVGLWQRESSALSAQYPWVQIFENKGALMGCSSPHPHGQVWATSYVPTLAQREDEHQRSYGGATPLLLDYARREIAANERVVTRNARWVALVPYWAAWPFETLLLPLEHRAQFDELDPRDVADLAELIGTLMPAYDRLFDVSFPYSMGWHGRGRDHARGHWQLHAHVYPPLLRSATVRKFMVGFEMLAEAQRDLPAEEAAQRLRAFVRT